VVDDGKTEGVAELERKHQDEKAEDPEHNRFCITLMGAGQILDGKYEEQDCDQKHDVYEYIKEFPAYFRYIHPKIINNCHQHGKSSYLFLRILRRYRIIYLFLDTNP